MESKVDNTNLFSNTVHISTRSAYNSKMNNNKATIEYIVAADSAIVHEDSKKVSLIGIFTEVRIPKELPSIGIPITVFARLKNVTGKLSFNISILKPNGEALVTTSIDGDNKDRTELNLRAIFPLVIFEEIGEHKIQILLDGNALETKGINIKVSKNV